VDPNGQASEYHRTDESQVMEIAQIPQGDFGDADTLKLPKYNIEKKELPGGAGFTYAVGQPGPEDLEIMIFDGDTLAAELDLFATQDVTGAWRVNTVAVDPEYRSRGLGKALYGIALSILKLTIEAGDTQTKHGQRMWLMLNSIPGVEVVGYNMVPTDQYKQHKGDKIIDQDKTWTRYTFPVQPGVHSMRSHRPGTGMYTSQASMIAQWTGQ
jgi:GNAT superfamily N-acetyltransferase